MLNSSKLTESLDIFVLDNSHIVWHETKLMKSENKKAKNI